MLKSGIIKAVGVGCFGDVPEVRRLLKEELYELAEYTRIRAGTYCFFR